MGQCGLRDRRGETVLVGRVSLMVDTSAPGYKPADSMLPATHLRAAMFVLERGAAPILGRRSLSYILDLSPYPADAMRGRQRYWDADGFVDDSRAAVERRAPCPHVGPHLREHVTMPTGLPVLKEVHTNSYGNLARCVSVVWLLPDFHQIAPDCHPTTI